MFHQPSTAVAVSDSTTIDRAATLILRVFDSYFSEFLILTRRAKARFEQRDWKGGRRDSLERLNLYEKVLSQISVQIEDLLGKSAHDRPIWIELKKTYAGLIAEHVNDDLAETFFNSVTRKLLKTVGIDREVEFFYLETRPEGKKPSVSVCTRYGQEKDTRVLIRKIMEDHPFRGTFADLDRDVEQVANEVDLFLWPAVRNKRTYTVEILKPCFFRNKVAYIVGRILTGARTSPIIIPLYNDETGIYVDSVLLHEADADNVLGFAYSYFQVEVDVPRELVRFLQSILPHKPLSDLYNSIGFYKHGKTEFYRDLHRFVHVSKKQFVVAPGDEGAVMIVFTLPEYHHVFKVIKDKPCFVRSNKMTVKEILKAEVKERYRFVCSRDRVGRLVDTQEFENVRFKVKRYSDALIQEFAMAAKDTVSLKGGYVVIDHLYLQRKVDPLPLYLLKEKSPDFIRQAVIDLGYFIKDLAGTGLFPADLFNTWNYGVTEGHRVVLYDYDDIIPLEHANFKMKPEPSDDDEAIKMEVDWITADPNDFFMDEIDTFLGIPDALKGVFRSVHRDLLTTEFWQRIKARVQNGEVIDIIPYDREKRFRRLTREA